MVFYVLMLIMLFFNACANVQNLSVLTTNMIALAESPAAIKAMPTATLKLIKEEIGGEHPYTEYALGNYNIRLIIQDILQIPADAIVNAANEGCLGGGGIDGVISKAGGSSVTGKDQYTTLYDLRVALPVIRTTSYGVHIRCPLGDGRITRGGWLQYQYKDEKVGTDKNEKRASFNYVIHAVGPQCSGNVTQEQKEALATTYVNVLKRVEAFNKNPQDKNYPEFAKIDISDLGQHYKIKSLSFPTISTGIFGCTTGQTAEKVVRFVYDFLNTHSHLEIQQINFLFWDPRNLSKAKADYNIYKQAFAKYLNK